MERTQRWRLERRVSVSVLVQLVTLAGLIMGSWVNLQRQLDLVSRDVKQLLTAQEYRLRTVEQKRSGASRPMGRE